MADGVIRLPPDGSGKSIYATVVTRGGVSYYMPATVIAELYTYAAVLMNSAPGAAKNHFGLFNATGSGKKISIRKIFVNSYMTGAQVGAALSVNLVGSTSAGTGTTTNTIRKFDTTDPDLPPEITATHTYTVQPTVVTNREMASITINSEESITHPGKIELFSAEDSIS